MRKLFICLAAVAALACTISCDKNDSEDQVDDVTAIKEAVNLATAGVLIHTTMGTDIAGIALFFAQGDGSQIGGKQKLRAAIYTSGANDIDPDKIVSVKISERGTEANAISVVHEGFQMIAPYTALCMVSKDDVMEANSDIRPIAAALQHGVLAAYRTFMVDLATLGGDKKLYVKPSEEVAYNMEPLKDHALLTIVTDVSKAYYAKCIGQVEEIKADGPEGEVRYKLEEMVDFAQAWN